MKRGEKFTLKKGEIKSLSGTRHDLEYLGIEDQLVSFNFYKSRRNPCKILVPLDRIVDGKGPINILKYSFLIPELHEDNITLEYFCRTSKNQ